jgi:hypothetical protein
MREHVGLATRTLRCWCGAPIRAASDPARGAAVLRHGDDAHPLGRFDDPLIARVLAGEPTALEEPAIRAWLRGYHREPLALRPALPGGFPSSVGAASAARVGGQGHCS